MTREEVGWLAGIIDGEGCIGLYKNQWDNQHVRISVTNTNLKLLRRVKSLTGCGTIQTKGYHSTKPNWKPGYHWRCSKSEDVTRLLLILLPYLVIKRPQAMCALQACGTVRTGVRVSAEVRRTRNQLHRRMKSLNRKGK